MLHFDTKMESELPLEGLLYDLLRLREKPKIITEKIWRQGASRFRIFRKFDKKWLGLGRSSGPGVRIFNYSFLDLQEEEIVYPVSSAIAETGGALGLFLGLSIMGILTLVVKLNLKLFALILSAFIKLGRWLSKCRRKVSISSELQDNPGNSVETEYSDIEYISDIV